MEIFSFIIWTIFVFVMGGSCAFWFIYSPKAKVRNRWREIKKLKIFVDMDKERKERGETDGLAENTIEKLGTDINYMLKEDFDPEADKEYIEKNNWVKGKWVI